MFKREVRQMILEKKLPTPSYFVMYFGNQGFGNKPKESHTFASYIEVSKNGSQKWSTISWLPADFSTARTIHIFDDLKMAIKEKILGRKAKPVPGKNFSLNESLAWSQEGEKALAVWGPSPIPKEEYEDGLTRLHFLNTSGVKYLADDFGTRRKGSAMNCFHAVGDRPNSFVPPGGILNSGWGMWGIDGTYHVLQHRIKSIKERYPGQLNPADYRLFNSHWESQP